MRHSTQRLLSMALGVALLMGALIVFLNFVRPEYRSAQEAKGENLSRRNLLENQKATVEQVQQIVGEYRGNSTLQTVLELALPTSNDEPDAVNQLANLAGKHTLTVQSFSIQHPGTRTATRNQRGTAATSTSILKPVGVLNLQARLTGTYENFRAFLSDIETNLRLMDIQSIAVTPIGKSSQNFYTFDVTVATYYQTN